MELSYFVLRDRTVSPVSERTWARTVASSDHRVAETRLDGPVTIRTDFVGAGSILFETCVYLGAQEKHVQRARCLSWESAMTMHEQFVEAWSAP